ncbi:MAG: hypothetical protein NUV91_09850 [Candidatus Omnitrophica bacterium]|nr:hypothetical protein [Candidatus Omnitrophota bacterium]
MKKFQTSRRVAMIGLAVFLCALFPMASFAEVSVTQDILLTHYDVNGNRANSFYPYDRNTYVYEKRLDFRQDLTGREGELFGDVVWRTTDDSLVDPETNSIEELTMTLKESNGEMVLGDYYASFSDYSVNNLLRGGKFVLGEDSGSHKLIVIGGADVARWDDLWQNRQEEFASKKNVWGVRSENKLFDNFLEFNLNYAGLNDQWNEFISTSSPERVQVLTTDSKINLFPFLSMYGEYATSLVDENDPIEYKIDQAFKVGSDFKMQAYQARTEYSRVGQHFSSISGFAPQDLQALLYDATAYLPQNVQLVHYIHLDADNINKNKTTTTKQLNPGGRLIFEIPWDVKVELSGDLRKRYTTDKSVSTDTQTYGIQLGKDFDHWGVSTNYSHADINDMVTASQERDQDTIGLNFDGDFEFNEVQFNWNLGEDLQHEHHRIAAKSDILFNTNGGLRVVFPSTLTFESQVSFRDSNYYLNASDSTSNKLLLSLSREIRKDMQMSLSYDQAGYDFFDGDNNYIERIFRTKLSCKF